MSSDDVKEYRRRVVDLEAEVERLRAVMADRLADYALFGRERDGDSTLTGDLAADMAAYAQRLKARAEAAEAKVAAASRWANRFAEFLESDCDPEDAVCHGFDVTDDGRCSLAADLDNLRAIIRGDRDV